MASATSVAQRIISNVGRTLQGKEDNVALAVMALLARGHLLIEDVPGVGKTTLARSLAQSVAVSYRRVQFTSDLLPSDVLGGSVYHQATGHFSFRPGPLFTHVLLADEINRTPPRTQSALLEAMEERHVSIDGETHVLEEPFFVVATQNPREFYGTYPLPESELDRFLLRIDLGYPPAHVEKELIATREQNGSIPDLQPVAERHALLAAQDAVNRIQIQSHIVGYIHQIITATRQTPLLDLGASTRAALALSRAVRSRALVLGRDHVTPDDVKAMVVPALAHRVRVAGVSDTPLVRGEAVRIIEDILHALPVPL
ncbi:MAG: MoxR family ATPase [Myxococcales bacterium]|nr:MoxR family ATPase [Myxococcales bacterium]MCB9707515.1 MoxR family ATPase [Myxococcales bacterium]